MAMADGTMPSRTKVNGNNAWSVPMSAMGLRGVTKAATAANLDESPLVMETLLTSPL
jgi:hypothetical protein